MNWQFLRCYYDKPGKIPRAQLGQRLLGGGVAALIVAGFQSLGWLVPAEEMLYQTWYKLRGTQEWDSRIAIVAIDEAAVKELYGESRSREYYVQLLKILAPAQPSAIVLNVLLDEPAPEDGELATLMQESPPVVLTVTWDQEGLLKMPDAQLLQQASAVGHIVSTAGNDGITRTVVPEIQGIPALGVASYQVYAQQACTPKLSAVNPFNWLFNERSEISGFSSSPKPPTRDRICSASETLKLPKPFWVNWPAPKSELTEYPILDVIRGKFSASEFTNKIVLVGPTMRGLDVLQTPYDLKPPANGIHLQAAILHNLLNDNYLHPIGISQNRFLMLLTYLLSGSALSYAIALRISHSNSFWSLRQQAAAGGLLFGSVTLFSFVLFQHNYLLPVVPIMGIYSLVIIGAIVQERLKMRDRLRVSEQQLWKQSFYDNLTGLPNRALLLQRLEQATARTKWDNNYQFAVLFIELDRYKVINSQRTHSLNDQLLVLVAAKMQGGLETILKVKVGESSIPQFTLAHFSGDTFTILLENLHDLDEAMQVAEQIYLLLSSPLEIEGQEVFCSVSIGIAASTLPWSTIEPLDIQESAEISQPAGLETSQYVLYSSLAQNAPPRVVRQPEIILREAEIAMYQAKARGKVPFAVFNRNLYREALGLLQLETDLRRAIAETDLKLDQVIRRAAFFPNASPNHQASLPYDSTLLPVVSDRSNKSEFRLDYQPIVSLSDGKITAFEALVRWHHPKRGMISPVEFIPLAEETGLITSLGWWILREACCQLRTWQELFPERPPVTMVVNLSAIQLTQLQVKEQIQLILQETGVDSRYLKLEITESGLMENVDATIELLEQLKALGIQLSIDDFGTGYSSLGRLHYLPVDTLKIDQSFIRRTQFEEESWEIVQTIITLAHNLNMTVVAEGIEAPEQLARLKYLKCDYGQGYLFAKPLNASSAVTLLITDPQW